MISNAPEPWRKKFERRMRERPLPKGCSGTTTVRLIREAGRDPIERDMLYRPVTRTETSFTVAV
jgi:hypothetical protein